MNRTQCVCTSQWCRLCTPEGPGSRPYLWQRRREAEAELEASQKAEAVKRRQAETRERALVLPRVEARRLREADPRVELQRQAQAYARKNPDATFGDVARELGVSVDEVLMLLHGKVTR